MHPLFASKKKGQQREKKTREDATKWQDSQNFTTRYSSHARHHRERIRLAANSASSSGNAPARAIPCYLITRQLGLLVARGKILAALVVLSRYTREIRERM